MLCYPSHLVMHHHCCISSRQRYLWSTIIPIQNCRITQKQLVDTPIDHLMKWRDWCEYPPSYNKLQLWQLQTMFNKAVTMLRPRENIALHVLLSMTAIAQKSAAKQHLLICSLLNKTIQLQSKHGNVDKLLLLSKAKDHTFPMILLSYGLTALLSCSYSHYL